ncbi:MAG: tRNA-dihydrouridine synthase, partial [Nitrospirota bacterium]
MMAPMVGLTHIAFRQVVVSLGGCGIFYSEMLSARRILDDIKQNNVNLKRLSNERPFFYQLVGNDPIEFAKAINALEEYKDEAGNPPD